MRSLWFVFGCVSVLAGCWVTRAEIGAKVQEIDPPAETGDTGEPPTT